MNETSEHGSVDFAAGGYRYIPGVFQYSAGVAASGGFRIDRVRFPVPLPMAEAYGAVERIVAAAGRPMTAFCACELRSPGQHTESSFRAFNEAYVEKLERWGLFRNGVNPVARSNVCPEFGPPETTGLHAFSFTVADAGARPTFVVSGGAEVPEGLGNYRDHIVRLGDVGAGGLLQKARFVLNEMERRLGRLGFGWRDTTAVQVYTIHDIHPFLGPQIAERGAAASGVTWHFCRPPVVDLEYEMDCRGITIERMG